MSAGLLLTYPSYINHAFNRYKEFKKTDHYFGQIKFETLSELNQYLGEKAITKENITDIIKTLEDKNPEKDFYAFWTNLQDLSEFAESRPDELSNLVNHLLYSEEPIQSRIHNFREQAKEFKKDIQLGGSIFGYILAAYDRHKYPLYKEDVLRHIKESISTNFKLTQVGENYSYFLQLCEEVQNYLFKQGEDPSILDVQDFFYCLTTYDKLIVESAVDYLYEQAKQLKSFSENDNLFLEEIKSLDADTLDTLYDQYSGQEKVNNIRFLVVDQILKQKDISINDLEQIKATEENKYKTNILHSWNNFTILFQLYYSTIKFKVNLELKKIHRAIRSIDSYEAYSLEENKLINDFGGNRNLGSTRVWLAVYPEYQPSHKKAAQLYLLINEEGVHYGLFHGSEKETPRKNDLKSQQDPNYFTYEKLVQKFESVQKEFDQENKKKPTYELATDFLKTFRSYQEANWVLDWIHETLGEFGVEEQGDTRVSVNFTKDSQVRVSLGRWLLIGYKLERKRESNLKTIMLEEDIDPLEFENFERFKQYHETNQVVLVYLTLEQFQESENLRNSHQKAVQVAKEELKFYKYSAYRKEDGDRQLERAVFDETFRHEILTNGFDKKQKENDEKRYFWLTANPSIWSVETIRDGQEVDYTLYNEKGNKRRIFEAFERAQVGDRVLFYESTPRKEVMGVGEITKEQHFKQDDIGQDNEAVSIRFIEGLSPIKWQQLLEVEELKNCKPISNGAQGSLFEITESEYETILSLEEPESTDFKARFPSVEFERSIDIDNLYFENKDTILKQVQTALKNGKHIILTGPPGTGKSKLAKEICEKYDVDYTMATATSDWSTFETMGGYRPNADGTLSFQPGLFLECFKDRNTYHPINKWLVIDEMNRADIDKAFGSLFSALTGDAIRMNFQADSGQIVQLRPQELNEVSEPTDYDFVIPEDWRLIGTMNTLDKASLYEMSYAFMRRFAFIPVGVPKKVDEQLIRTYLDSWGITNYSYKDTLAFIWQRINEVRQIGPAIIEDLARYTNDEGDFTSAIILYVLPQFEGLLDQEIIDFIYRISEDKVIDQSRLLAFAEDFFHIKV